MKWKLILIIFGIVLVFLVGVFVLGDEIGIKILNFNQGEEVSAYALEGGDIGYEFLDDGKVVHIWNTQDDYFFNKSSGIQFTNHFQDYWTRNIFCIGYYSGEDWVKINCADELENFNREIQTDNLTYVNATLWKDISYGSYDLRLGINYYLGLNDKNLSITIYGKNIGIDIPYDLGFAWKITDWDIPPRTHDFITINGTSSLIHLFNGSTIFKNMDYAFIKGYDNNNFLRLDWNEDLDYAVKMYGNATKEDFYVALLINAGHFNPNQEKSTTFYWIDAIEVDATSSGTDSGTEVLVVHTTTGTSENSILIVTVQVTDSYLDDRTIFNVTHNGDELTHLAGADADDGVEERTEIWYRVNPDEGENLEIVVTATDTCTDISLGAISLTGVDTTSIGLLDSYNESNQDDTTAIFSDFRPEQSQSFTGTGLKINLVQFYLNKQGSPTGNAVVKIYAHNGTYGESSEPIGPALATSDNFDVSTLDGDLRLVDFSFPTPFITTDGTKYCLVIEYYGGGAAAYIRAGFDGSSPTHSGNLAWYDGESWTTASASDFIFYIYSGPFGTATGDSTPPTLDITTFGDSSYVIDALAISESDGTKIATGTAGGQIIHKTDVGGDTHAASYVDAGGAGVQTMNYTDVDSDKSWAMSAVAVQVFVSEEDTVAPKWFDNSTNGTTAGTYIEHRVRWTDAGLSGYIFEFDNGTGTFSNDSWVSMTGINNWSNVTKYVNETEDSTIRWRVYANDTASPTHWNQTDIFQYNTTSAQCWADIEGGIYVPSGCTYYVPDGAYIT